MDYEVTNIKYELIWTNSLSNIQDYAGWQIVGDGCDKIAGLSGQK